MLVTNTNPFFSLGSVVQTDLWTTRYRPKQMKELCGNNAAVLRLQKWLDAWYNNYKKGFKSDDPEKTGTFRAVLISGPPGIGKTSAAHLVAESLGYSVVEFNASDTRSKRSLDVCLTEICLRICVLQFTSC